MKNKSNKKNTKMTWKQLIRSIKEAQKDPEFMKEVRKFIRITTS